VRYFYAVASNAFIRQIKFNIFKRQFARTPRIQTDRMSFRESASVTRLLLQRIFTPNSLPQRGQRVVCFPLARGRRSVARQCGHFL